MPHFLLSFSIKCLIMPRITLFSKIHCEAYLCNQLNQVGLYQVFCARALKERLQTVFCNFQCDLNC